MDEPPVENIAPPETDEPPAAPVEKPVRKRRIPWGMVILLLVVGLVGYLILQRRHNATEAAPKLPPQPPGVAISTAVAERGDIGVYINALGSVSPLYTVTSRAASTVN